MSSPTRAKRPLTTAERQQRVRREEFMLVVLTQIRHTARQYRLASAAIPALLDRVVQRLRAARRATKQGD